MLLNPVVVNNDADKILKTAQMNSHWLRESWLIANGHEQLAINN
jgi:hypothetical protein